MNECLLWAEYDLHSMQPISDMLSSHHTHFAWELTISRSWPSGTMTLSTRLILLMRCWRNTRLHEWGTVLLMRMASFDRTTIWIKSSLLSTRRLITQPDKLLVKWCKMLMLNLWLCWLNAHRAMTFMSWNYEMTEPLYPSIANGFLEKIDDCTNICSSPIAHTIREIVVKEDGNHNDPSVIAQVCENIKKQNIVKKHFDAPTFDHVALWVSEYSSTFDTDSLLQHANAYLNSSWCEGGLYYWRHNTTWDEQGNYIKVNPVMGNSAITYTRLNVRHGQKKMWDESWTKKQLKSLSYLNDIELNQGVDCLQGCWDENRKAMITTFWSWNDSHVSIKPTVKNMPAETYSIYINDCLKDLTEISDTDSEITMKLEVAEEEVDLVVLLDHVTWYSQVVSHVLEKPIMLRKL